MLLSLVGRRPLVGRERGRHFIDRRDDLGVRYVDGVFGARFDLGLEKVGGRTGGGVHLAVHLVGVEVAG